MKKLSKAAAVTLPLLMTLSLSACGSMNTTGSEQKQSTMESEDAVSQSESDKNEAVNAETSYAENNDTADDSETVNNTLVVYFSRTGEQHSVGMIEKGNTAIVADMIADYTGADIFEILSEIDAYPTTYDELADVAKQEQKGNARPAYAGEVPDLSQYDTIFVGAPVWWGDWPMIMYTFFEENSKALSEKTLVPFNTNEGSGLSGFDKKLSGVLPDSTVTKGLAIRGSDAQNKQDKVKEDVSDWLSGLGY